MYTSIPMADWHVHVPACSTLASRSRTELGGPCSPVASSHGEALASITMVWCDICFTPLLGTGEEQTLEKSITGVEHGDSKASVNLLCPTCKLTSAQVVLREQGLMNEPTDTQQSDKASQARRKKKGKRKSIASDDEAASGDAKASPSEKVRRFRIPTSQGAMRYPRAPDRSAQSSAPAASSIPPIPGLASEPSTSVKPPNSPASSGPKSPNTPLTQASPDGDGSPGLVDTHFKFEFSCAEAHAKARHVADPLGALMQKIEKISDISQFKKLVHSESLFDGFANVTMTYETIQSKLQSTLEDTRTHRDLSDDSDVVYRHLCPIPVAKGTEALSSKEGWHEEATLQEIKATVAFCEHPGTRLKVQSTDMHARAPNIPFLMGAGGSARKSSMTDYGTDLLTTNAAAPDEFKQRQFLAQDSTLRGIYDSIIATGSCGIVSDEASCTYETPDSGQGNGVHYLSQPKMCKIVNAEALDALTGKGSTH